ncbi:hypothetical protein L2E82_09773 [Cichorium intybus]|uniref:Uncharacterized protein n=1 Tax=Cichorium intybus TaxID=13427 RepID=A0ACB9G901_CICIN|nr:hypothetical protein L2E82_09773 [Cichorium intybus]
MVQLFSDKTRRGLDRELMPGGGPLVGWDCCPELAVQPKVLVEETREGETERKNMFDRLGTPATSSGDFKGKPEVDHSDNYISEGAVGSRLHQIEELAELVG